MHGLLLVPLLVPLPFCLSGAVRAALDVGIAAALGVGTLATLALGALVALRARPARGDRRLGVVLLAFLALAGLLVTKGLYNPYFDGLVTLGGGDAGNHVALGRQFIHTQPDTYFKFVTFYALVHWVQALFGLDAFGAFRVGFYLVPAVMTLCLASGFALVAEEAPPERRAPPWPAGALLLAAFAAAALRVILPLLHYHQADGFYPHLFGLAPLFACWALYGAARGHAARLATLLFWVAISRFTYGLNLGDIALTAAGLIAAEALGLPRAARGRLPLLTLAGAALAAAGFAYGQLLRLAPVSGGIVVPRVRPLLEGETLLVGLVLALPAVATRLDIAFGPGARRLARFAGGFGLVNLVAQLLYLAGRLPGEYYFPKYHLHAVVLLLGAAVILAAHALGQLAPRPRRAEAWRLVTGAGVVAALVGAMVLLGASYRGYRASFAERMAGAPPWARIGPLADPDAWQRVTATLASEGKRFGGLLAPSWPLTNFMNAGLGRYGGWEQFRLGTVEHRPGYCAFWYAGDRARAAYDAVQAETGGTLADAVRALEAVGDQRCAEYAARWDPGLRQRFCHRCF